jgi:hypothetical protein
LLDKKEKLFKSKDLSKWGAFPPENAHLQEKLKDELLRNKEKAFNYMMPKETNDLDEKREELSFFTNQCWEEIRRTGTDNGKLLRDHFKEMASQ